MANIEVEDKIYKIIEKIFSIKHEDIDIKKNLDELDIDSFALVELIVEIQETFKINFDPKELKNIKTLESLIKEVESKL